MVGGMASLGACQTCLWFACRSTSTKTTESPGNDDEDNSDSYKQGVQCWSNRKHRNHGNDENHGNPECKSPVLQITGLEIPEFWVHANGGVINGGVACVCTNWRVFARFCAFLLAKMACRKSRIWHNRAKMCKKRIYAIPPLVTPPLRLTENFSSNTRSLSFKFSWGAPRVPHL